MSEFIDNSIFRKARLKELILRLHEGESEQMIRQELMDTLSTIPYGEVIEVEQELIEEGLPEEEVLRLCDVHSSVLKGNVDHSTSQQVPEGHPVDILQKENMELQKVTHEIGSIIGSLDSLEAVHLKQTMLELTGLFNQLSDVDKHYKRKEFLVFPYLEKSGITGPPKVMWGKHDEIRELLNGSLEVLHTAEVDRDDLITAATLVLEPAIRGVNEMVVKEEEILFPILMDNLTAAEWYEIQKQSLEIGYCLYDPAVEWVPDELPDETIENSNVKGNQIRMPSGSFSVEEIKSILNTLPVDITFVDKHDKVKYFSQSNERIFQRSRAIINRDVRHCHPPASAHIVDRILEDFKSGKQQRAPFWINMHGRFIYIEYFALHNDDGEYLGTLEVSQDLTNYRKLEGEQRILSYQ